MFRLDAGRKRPASAERVTTRLVVSDGRTTQARRFKALVESFVAEAGGLEDLTPSAEQLIRNLAVVILRAEELTAASASGVAIDPIVYVSTIRNQTRLLRDFQKLITPPGKPGPKPKPKRPILTLPEAKPKTLQDIADEIIAARERNTAS